jgi:uncharacterized membrane protein (UPF0182 family)
MSRRVPPRGFFNGESPFGRLPTEPSFPTIRISRRGVIWIVVAAFVLLILFLLKPFATLYTDWLWFRALGYGGVFGTRFTAQIWSFFIFAIIFWVIGAANVLLALNSGRRLSSIGIRQRLITAPSTILAMLVVFLLGLLFGQIASGQWQTILTFFNQKPFNVQDPIWHKDVSFYVFTLPFYRFLWGWFLGVVILMVLVVAGLYASRAGFQNLVLPTRAVRHLSVLAAVFAALLAIHYRLDLYELLLSRRGGQFVYGIGYADAAARIPAYWIMTVLMVLIAIGLLANVVGARLTPLPVALVAWLGAAFILLVIFPGIVQRFQVAPSELSRETPYIKNMIDFTRQAYGLTSIADRPFTPSDTVTADAVARNPQTVQNARLWDPQLALPYTLENLQSLRTYYQFYPTDVAVDRYQLGDQYLQLLLAARELNPDKLAQVANTWVALKLQYTHGYGVVAARANQATAQGDPALTLQDIPPVGVPTVTQPGIYFGRHTSNYVLTDSSQHEFDYPFTTDQYTQWRGHTGVPLSSALRSLAFAIRFGDINMLISPQLTSQTQVLFNRAVQDRVAALAPFLQFDNDPYVVVVDGKVYWILDGFTVTDHYPYSEMAPDDGGPLLGVNYMRNSVKVVIDAYDGTTTFYQIDTKDAIANTYASIFPGLFKPFSAMPAGLQAHIRYPRDLFNRQAERFTYFHMTDPTVFYLRSDLWNVAKETQQSSGAQVPIRPFYVIMRLPGEPKEEFVTILPYTPHGKTNMIAYLAARSDQPDYGTLFDFRFPKDSLVTGPQQIEANIDQAPAIKSQFALLNATGQGSSVIRGNLLVIPIENSLLYIEPVYLQSTNLQKPQLKKVIAASGQNVVMEDTLDKALASLLGTAPPSTPTGPSGPPASGTVAQLIAQANAHYIAAQAALRNGDFTTYAKEIQTVGSILNQLATLQPAPSASPSASASASATAKP